MQYNRNKLFEFPLQNYIINIYVEISDNNKGFFLYSVIYYSFNFILCRYYKIYKYLLTK